MKALCYCKTDFEDFCKARGWNDTNVPEDWAFISICSTPEIVRNVIQDSDEHYFKNPHPNVLNLEFDDITSQSEQVGPNTTAFGITRIEAFKVVKFIKENIDLGKNFLIHCRAGKSRSQAIVRYMITTYGKVETSKFNPPVAWNSFVLDSLRKASHLIHEDIRGLFIANNIDLDSFEIKGGGLVRIVIKGKTYVYAPEEGAWVITESGEILEDFQFWERILKTLAS